MNKAAATYPAFATGRHYPSMTLTNGSKVYVLTGVTVGNRFPSGAGNEYLKVEFTYQKIEMK